MGAVLESRQVARLDLFTRPPTVAQRARAATRGFNGLVTAAGVAAVAAGIWAASQFVALSSARSELAPLRASVERSMVALGPAREVAERRASFAQQVDFVKHSYGERSSLTGILAAIGDEAPTSIRFDSLQVARSGDTWSSVIEGEATGGSGAQAVRNLDAFYRSVRARAGVSSAALEQFDYPVSKDSTRVAGSPVTVQFRLSLSIPRGAGESR